MLNKLTRSIRYSYPLTMDTGRAASNLNPREKASCISVVTFWWTIGMFVKGYKKILGTEDLYNPLLTDRSSVLGDRLERRWRVELENSKRTKRQPSLLKSIFRAFLFEFFVLACVEIMNEFILRLCTPILLGALLQYFKPESIISYENALTYAGGISIAVAIMAVTLNQYMFRGLHLGGRIRIAVSSVVYRKSLRLSTTALGEAAPGKIVNLVANDVNRFQPFALFMHHLWSAPLSAIVIGYFMYTQAGYAGLIGIAIVFVAISIQAYASKLLSKLRLKTVIKTDERVRLMNEIISGVQIIKMYAWEKPFCALVNLARRLELNVVRQSSYINGILMTFKLFTTRMALFGTLVTMVLMGETLSADKVFVFSSYFAILARTLGDFFVQGLAETAECLVAVKRLQNFLTLEEFHMDNVTAGPLNVTIGADCVDLRLNNLSNNTSNGNKSNVSEKTNAVKLDNVVAQWSLQSSDTTLKDIQLELAQGKLYIVIGMVGSGKSSLLSTILGELNLLRGNVTVNGDISYASQEAWVFGSSVRQNILFGQEFDRQRYQRVVTACDLLKDFEQFPQGDQTIVGEHGKSLSGGQKARINLARAVYRQAEIYLLDDPLSAVDARVGKHLFKECLQSYLGGKTRILATHQLQYVEEADSIILMDQGRMYQYSNCHELLKVHPQYNRVFSKEKEGDVSNEYSAEVSHIRQQLPSDLNEVDTDGEEGKEKKDSAKFDASMEATSLGAVKGNLTLHYFQVGSGFFMSIALIVLFLLTQIQTSLNDYFIPIFIEADEYSLYHKDLYKYDFVGNVSQLIPNKDSTTLEEGNILPMECYIYIYAAIVLSIFVIGIIRSFTFCKACLNSSQQLHDRVFSSLIRTSMRFFDNNPSGRILNRFSKDFATIDEQLPKAMIDAGQILLMMFGSLVVSCMVNPMFLIPIVFIGIIFYWIRRVYLKTSKNVKRLEGITRSPTFTHLNATLHGISTIRAYKAQKLLEKEFDNFQDVHTSSWYMFTSCSLAFAFSLDVCCVIITSLVTFSFLLLKDNFSGGQVGLAITQMVAITGLAQWGMRQSTEVTNQMTSVERVLEYVNLEPEANLRDSNCTAKRKVKRDKSADKLALVELPKDWPRFGCVNFQNVYLRYSDKDAPILQDLTFTVRSAEKIGIVGRTGAGKSSLISALFRLANVEGTIEIDGIDTSSIALEDLRRHISIIPQDPILFSGTLRRNLDPFNEFSDRHLWEALEEVQLKDTVMATGHSLDNQVLDRGSNYSVGQRQLVCLARAILRNNRILVLDEATANVDPHTDAFIQSTIRKKFESCTVLTVAHRLNTIMDSDRVLVMDNGHLKEYDHPYILLQNANSSFTLLVKETGEAMYEQLYKVAHDDYVTKNGEPINKEVQCKK